MHCLPFLTSGVFRILETVGWSTEMRSDRAMKDDGENVTFECTARSTFCRLFVFENFAKKMSSAWSPKYAFACNVMLTKCYTVQCAMIVFVCFFCFLFINLQTRKESHIVYGVGLTILFFLSVQRRRYGLYSVLL